MTGHFKDGDINVGLRIMWLLWPQLHNDKPTRSCGAFKSDQASYQQSKGYLSKQTKKYIIVLDTKNTQIVSGQDGTWSTKTKD